MPDVTPRTADYAAITYPRLAAMTRDINTEREDQDEAAFALAEIDRLRAIVALYERLHPQ